MNQKDKLHISGMYREAHCKKQEEIGEMLKAGEIDPIGEYCDFDDSSKLEQDAWQYLEHYCYKEPYTNAGEEISNKQGFLEGVAYVVEKLGGKCNY